MIGGFSENRGIKFGGPSGNVGAKSGEASGNVGAGSGELSGNEGIKSVSKIHNKPLNGAVAGCGAGHGIPCGTADAAAFLYEEGLRYGRDMSGTFKKPPVGKRTV